MTPLTLTIHRSAHEIGGNCIELALGGERILLDMGRPLAAPKDARGLLPASLDQRAPAMVLISHPHQDHYGLLEEAPPSWPVRCGEPTRRLMQVTAAITGRTLPHATTTWRSGEQFSVGPFQITPLLTDHAAFDAHMLLIEAANKRLLYSGDFRMHGRKRALVERLSARRRQISTCCSWKAPISTATSRASPNTIWKTVSATFSCARRAASSWRGRRRTSIARSHFIAHA